LITKVDGTQTLTVFVDDISIEVTVLLVSEMENKYSGNMLRLKGPKSTYTNISLSSFYPKQTQ
jgi:hypothetical protein